MYFGQLTHPDNWACPQLSQLSDQSLRLIGPGCRAEIGCSDVTDGVSRLRVISTASGCKEQLSDAVVTVIPEPRIVRPLADGSYTFRSSAAEIVIDCAQLTINFASGASIHSPERGLGFSDAGIGLAFKLLPDDRVLATGERTGGLDQRGRHLSFWNVDVLDVLADSAQSEDYDPTYASIPVAMLRTGERWIGLFFDNPGRALMNVGQAYPDQFIYQCVDGPLDLYLIDGPELSTVVERYTRLTGRAAPPPLWSLGYHQCRWGYACENDFRELLERFRRHRIPVSALWYDIDYMNGYRLFTWNEDHHPSPLEFNRSLARDAVRAVGIVDTGIKLEPGYPVYDAARGLLCQTAEGQEYVGRAWPGDVVFPDFTLEATRSWWADILSEFVRSSGFEGIWLDMNDPSTGFSSQNQMLFDQGRTPHERHHNQYAHFMAKATHDGCARALDGRRPFVLTRSASAGTQRYSAIWSGDNFSSWKHLRMSVPNSLNLGLSGFAFNGADVGGFAGDTSAELLVRWFQTGCLYPFFRSHSALGTRHQEPWALGARALACIRQAIALRYRLLPYFWNCMCEHYRGGHPVMRPLAYHFDDPESVAIDDQFLIGDALLAAPVLGAASSGLRGVSAALRRVHLPQGFWFDLNRGHWVSGGRTLDYRATTRELPLFARDGAILPCAPTAGFGVEPQVRDVELHVFTHRISGYLRYYQESPDCGNPRSIEIEAHPSGQQLHVSTPRNGDADETGDDFRVVAYGRHFDAVVRNRDRGETYSRSPRRERRRWLSRWISVLTEPAHNKR